MNIRRYKRGNERGNKIQNIIVVWEKGNVNGFKSKEAALLYIENVCKKTAPEMKYSVYSTSY